MRTETELRESRADLKQEIETQLQIVNAAVKTEDYQEAAAAGMMLSMALIGISIAEEIPKP